MHAPSTHHPSVVPRQVGTVSVVALRGAVDAASLRSFEVDLLSLAESGQARLAVDMRDVVSFDSSGLGLLLAVTKRARSRGGDVVLFSVPPAVSVVLRVTGMNRVVRVVDPELQALAALNG